MSEPPDEKTLAKVREAASLMGKLFIQQRARKAVFRPDHKGKWHWTAINEKYTMDDFVNHLTGTHCLGTYLCDENALVKFLAFDLDLAKESKYLEVYDVPQIDALTEAGADWDGYGTSLGVGTGDLEAALHDPDSLAYRWARIELLTAMRAINAAVKEKLELRTLSVVTGGGAHVLVPLPEPMAAIDVRSAGIEIASSLYSARQRNDIFFDYGGNNELTIEIFPKQDSMEGKEYGNLIRLPFGWHYGAAIRTYSIDPEAPAVPSWEWQRSPSIGTLKALAQGIGVS